LFDNYAKNQIYAKLLQHLGHGYDDKLYEFLSSARNEQIQSVYNNLKLLTRDVRYLNDLDSVSSLDIRDEKQSLALYDLHSMLKTAQIGDMADDDMVDGDLKNGNTIYLTATLIAAIASCAASGSILLDTDEYITLVSKAKEVLVKLLGATTATNYDIFSIINEYEFVNALPIQSIDTMKSTGVRYLDITETNSADDNVLIKTHTGYTLKVPKTHASADGSTVRMLLAVQMVFRLLQEKEDHQEILARLTGYALKKYSDIIEICMNVSGELKEEFKRWKEATEYYINRKPTIDPNSFTSWARTEYVASSNNIRSLVRCYKNIPNSKMVLSCAKGFRDVVIENMNELSTYGENISNTLESVASGVKDISAYSHCLEYASSLYSKNEENTALYDVVDSLRSHMSRTKELFESVASKEHQLIYRAFSLYYIFIKFNKSSLVNLYNHKIQPPVDVLMFRPMQTYQAASGVFCTAGGKCVKAYYGNERCTVQTDGANAQIDVNVSMSMAVNVVRPENVFMQTGIHIKGYLGGCNTKFYDYNTKNNKPSPGKHFFDNDTFKNMKQNCPSLVATFIKIGSHVPDILSLSGRFNQYKITDESPEFIQYSTAGRVSNHMDLASLDVFNANDATMSDDRCGNFTTYKGTTFYTDTNGVYGDFTTLDAGNSVWNYELDRPGYKSFRTGVSVDIPAINIRVK